MLKPRIIPTLLIRDRGLVKTKRFDAPVYLGDPVNAIKIYNEKEVDELVILDIQATKRGSIDWYMLNRLNREAFMPLGYGGGVKTVTDVEKIINLGYEKVIINSAFLQTPSLIRECSDLAGSQSIVVCVDVWKDNKGIPKVYDYTRKRTTGITPVKYCQLAEEKGAGEIILHSAEREGTYSGFDRELIAQIAESISIPVIALGGASSMDDIYEIFGTGISAAAAGSIFVFYGRLRAVLINYPVIKV